MSRGPGKWQRAILTELKKRPVFPLIDFFMDTLNGGGPVTCSVHAIHRAVKVLERSGQCVVAHVWESGDRWSSNKVVSIVAVAENETWGRLTIAKSRFGIARSLCG